MVKDNFIECVKSIFNMFPVLLRIPHYPHLLLTNQGIRTANAHVVFNRISVFPIIVICTPI